MKMSKRIYNLVNDVLSLDRGIRYYVIFFALICFPIILIIIFIDLFGCWIISED